MDLAGVFFFMIWLQFAKSDEKHKDRPASITKLVKFLTYTILIIDVVKAFYYYIALVAVS